MEDQQRILIDILDGKGSHVSFRDAFDGLTWEDAEKKFPGTPHSIWEILKHMIYWQEFSLLILDGEDPDLPEHASESWDAGACNEKLFHEAVHQMLRGLEHVKQHATLPLDKKIGKDKILFEEIMAVISHNSYHLGQIVQIRRALEAWPPPSGGDTW